MGNASQNSALRAYRRDLGIASRTADFLWKMIFASLPRRKKQTCQSGQEVVTLGNASIPPGVKSALEKGPKFCEPPKLDQVELLSLVRSTAARASVDNRDRCIQEGVDCLLPTKQTGTSRQPSVIKSLRAADLKLLQADKEGGFVLAPTTVYKEKADAAVTENFQVANVKPSKVKATASKLCEEAGLQKLASSVRAARGVNLSVFFSAKTHKPEVPFRVIVSEQGTWQRLVGRYLQRSLSVLPVEDPCLIRKPQIVSEFLQQECPSEVSFFSVDVKDLYYSLPMDQVCAEDVTPTTAYHLVLVELDAFYEDVLYAAHRASGCNNERSLRFRRPNCQQWSQQQYASVTASSRASAKANLPEGDATPSRPYDAAMRSSGTRRAVTASRRAKAACAREAKRSENGRIWGPGVIRPEIMIEHRTKPAAPGHPSYGGPSATDPSLPEYLSRALGMRAHLSGAARRQCPDDAIARYPSDGAAKLTDGHGRRTDEAAAAASIPFHPPRTRPTMGAIHHGRPFQRRQTAKGLDSVPRKRMAPTIERPTQPPTPTSSAGTACPFIYLFSSYTYIHSDRSMLAAAMTLRALKASSGASHPPAHSLPFLCRRPHVLFSRLDL
ncbi:hypothetical protein HPB51_029638 [Rhipicephalus microplus]|uniref:Tick transposon n=1 Tax=Rhipicephalus microplus TaxID=6941 RepID=A0A9J6CU18_RHIMP|nr:hypothetical protein HPB51_029638 [Rhipicephalus microplus]